MGETPNLLKYE